MKLSKLPRFLDDLAYICGLVFITSDRYLTHGIVDTRTLPTIIEDLNHKLWLEAHEE